MIKSIKITIIVIIIIVISFTIYAFLTAPKLNNIETNTNTPLTLSEEEQVKQFVTNYLAAYQDVHTKNNYDEILAFVADEVVVQMERENTPFKTNATNFDAFKILSLQKTNHEPYAEEVTGWKVTTQLSLGEKTFTKETSITVIKENGEWRATSWYFAP